MDKSELFIKQCDCDEVQGQRHLLVTKLNFKDGDYLANYRIDWKLVSKDTRKAQRTFVDIQIYHEGVTGIEDRGLVTWLPMQHQIQAMMIKDYDDAFILLDCFATFIGRKKYYYWSDASMECLWLCFYMEEKHGKEWFPEEERWVKG